MLKDGARADSLHLSALLPAVTALHERSPRRARRTQLVLAADVHRDGEAAAVRRDHPTGEGALRSRPRRRSSRDPARRPRRSEVGSDASIGWLDTQQAQSIRESELRRLLSGEPLDVAEAGNRLSYRLDRWHLGFVAWVPEGDGSTAARLAAAGSALAAALDVEEPALTRARGHFPNDAAALKCLYLVTRSLDPTGKGRARWVRWKAALNAFAITFEGRISPSDD